jgi:hypothetical protein
MPKKHERNWEIITMRDIRMMKTTLTDGSVFLYPVHELTSLSEWVYIVQAVEHSRMLALMGATQVYERPDQRSDEDDG